MAAKKAEQQPEEPDESDENLPMETEPAAPEPEQAPAWAE
jgi:hypothetical protein